MTAAILQCFAWSNAVIARCGQFIARWNSVIARCYYALLRVKQCSYRAVYDIYRAMYEIHCAMCVIHRAINVIARCDPLLAQCGHCQFWNKRPTIGRLWYMHIICLEGKSWGVLTDRLNDQCDIYKHIEWWFDNEFWTTVGQPWQFMTSLDTMSGEYICRKRDITITMYRYLYPHLHTETEGL